MVGGMVVGVGGVGVVCGGFAGVTWAWENSLES